jgi:predicted ATP-dependent protease
VREAVHDGLILVQTSGTRVGQVNGLAVYDFGEHRFGKVARITAAVGAGQAGVVNVERMVDLSGASHDKGVLILSGYLRETFGADRPLAFTASIVFEQSYGGVDGDSATCAEVFATLSALARVPVRQDLAVTGSMNQHGDVQAVGGVTDKVEGSSTSARRAGSRAPRASSSRARTPATSCCATTSSRPAPRASSRCTRSTASSRGSSS